MFYMVFKCFSGVFASVSSIFRRMLQVLYLDVSKEDRVLHLPSLLLLPAPVGHPSSPLPLLDVGDVWGDANPTWAREMAWKMDCIRGCSDAPSVWVSGR